MLHSRTETFLIPSFHFLLRSLILFCFAFADCFVFEKWLSHHFYCIFECLSLSISMYLSPCVCARVCWVFVTKIYALQFTHTHKNTERGREEESHKKQSKAFVSRLHRVESEKASTCGGWHCGNGHAKVLNSQLTKREFRFSMHCIVKRERRERRREREGDWQRGCCKSTWWTLAVLRLSWDYILSNKKLSRWIFL